MAGEDQAALLMLDQQFGSRATVPEDA